jgi:hypothetical protein
MPFKNTEAQGCNNPLLCGDIHYFRLPEVLQLIAMQWLTGRLSLVRKNKTVDIYIREGKVAFATGEERGTGEQIGSLLVRMGKLDQGAVDKALVRSLETGERLGRVLIDSGMADVDGIRTALFRQTERSVYRAMAWGEGSFSFECCAMPEFVEDIPLELTVESLILEGVRRIGEERAISEKIPSLNVIFTRPMYTPEQIEGMGLKGHERLVLELVDGKRDIKELIDITGLSEIDALRALFALHSAGFVRKHEPNVSQYRTQYL